MSRATSRHRVAAVVVAGALCVMAWLAGPSAAQPRRRTRAPSTSSKRHASVKQAFRTIVQPTYFSTVAVYCGGKQVALGAVVDKAGYVVTKASELKGEIQCKLRTGQNVKAQLAGTDKTNDIALLRIKTDKKLVPIRWADNDNPPIGSWIVTPGMGSDPVAVGVVSVQGRAPTRRRTRTPSSGFLGISFDTSGEAARIQRVIPNTGASRAGLRAGDLILKVGETATPSREALVGVLRKSKPGDKISLHLKRGRREMDVKATVGKWVTGRKLNPQEHMGSALSERSDGFSRILQHDTVLQASECGGAALDSSGKAVGVNIARAGRVESYTLPASLARPIIAKLKAAHAKKPPAKPKPKPKPKPAKPAKAPTTRPAKRD